jgi:hypothetical protein
MTEPLTRHDAPGPTRNARSWEKAVYETFTVRVPLPAMRVCEHGDAFALAPPAFTAGGDPATVQRSGAGIWFALDAYVVEPSEYLRRYAVPNPPKAAGQSEWLLQPRTVLNIGVASSLGMPGCGGAVQAEFVAGSPAPIPLGHRKVRTNVRM